MPYNFQYGQLKVRVGIFYQISKMSKPKCVFRTLLAIIFILHPPPLRAVGESLVKLHFPEESWPNLKAKEIDILFKYKKESCLFIRRFSEQLLLL